MPKTVAHRVNRPGRLPGHPPVTIPVAEDLLTEPGIPSRDQDVSFFSREYPLENMAIEESASVEWARDQRQVKEVDFMDEHQRQMEPIVEWVRTSGDLLPTAEPTGEDVTEAIRRKALELGYGEVGFTKNDRHYVYQNRKPDIKGGLPNAICLALEQDYDEAIAQFEEAIQLRPDFGRAYLTLGAVLGRQGRMKELEEVMVRLVSFEPTRHEAWFALAKVYRALGSTSKAHDAIRAALDGDTGKADYWDEYFNIGKAYEAEGQTDRAKDIFNSIEKTNPHRGQSKDSLQE